MESTRQQKVARLLQKDLGDIFQQKAMEYAPGTMITVTIVRISKDLSVAKVFLSLFATKDKEGTLNQIEKRKKEIRRELGIRVRHQLRIVPELFFHLDDSLDYIENIENALKK
jgi:ribosome-binding factor A